jgi:hypothetical protein
MQQIADWLERRGVSALNALLQTVLISRSSQRARDGMGKQDAHWTRYPENLPSVILRRVAAKKRTVIREYIRKR